MAWRNAEGRTLSGAAEAVKNAARRRYALIRAPTPMSASTRRAMVSAACGAAMAEARSRTPARAPASASSRLTTCSTSASESA